MAQTEDVAAGFVAIITLVLNLLPMVENTAGLTPDQNAALISLALILKTALGYIPQLNGGAVQGPAAASANVAAAPPALGPGVYAISGTNSTGGAFTGSVRIVTTQADALAHLTALGFTNISWGAKIA